MLANILTHGTHFQYSCCKIPPYGYGAWSVIVIVKCRQICVEQCVAKNQHFSKAVFSQDSTSDVVNITGARNCEATPTGSRSSSIRAVDEVYCTDYITDTNFGNICGSWNTKNMIIIIVFISFQP